MLQASWNRAGTRPDAHPVSHLVHECIAALSSGATFAVFGKRITRVVLFARVDSSMLYVLVCVAVHEGEESAFLLSVYADPAVRFCGLGSEALREATALLRRRRLRCEAPLLACVTKALSSKECERLLVGAGFVVSRIDGAQRRDGARVAFEPG